MGKSKKSNKGKSIGIIAIIIVLLFSSVVGVIYGILSKVEEFIKGIVGAVVNAGEAALDWLKHVFGKSRIIDGMYIYPLESDSVTQLKQQIEEQGIRTDEAGITEVMLRKMILTQAVTSFTKDTLCVAEVQEDEILKDAGYTDLNEYLETLDRGKSKDNWPINKYNYDLYYITDEFFYFKDSDDMMGNGKDKYYLGVIGSIKIKTSEGDTLDYVSNEEFEKAKTNFDKLNEKEKENEKQQERIDLLHKYTIDSNGEMVVHKIVKNTSTYMYTFTNNSSNTKIEDSRDPYSTYDVITVPLDVQGSIDTSKYTISIEFLINLLNMSTSPEFIDEFIDYALQESKITITAYLVEDEEKSYEKDTYKVKDNFVYELYDIVDLVDKGSDNMQTYKSLIYDRIYEGNHFEGSVVDLPDFENIDYDTAALVKFINSVAKLVGKNAEELRDWFKENVYSEEVAEEEAAGEETEEEKKEREQRKRNKIKNYVKSKDVLEIINDKTLNSFIDYILGQDIVSVNKISKYLLSAYDPSGFSLGDTLGEEITVSERAETSWEFYISSISTWYGNITYDDPIRNTEYFIDVMDCTQDEYNNFNENSLTLYEEVKGEESIKKIYIYEGRAEEVGITDKDINVTLINSADIYDNILKKDIRRRYTG